MDRDCLTCLHISCTYWRSQHITVVAVQPPSCVSLFATLWTAAHQASLSLAISQSLPRFLFIESVIGWHLILCHPLLLLPSIFPSIRVFFNELDVHIRWPRYWSFSIRPSNEYSGLISFRICGIKLMSCKDEHQGKRNKGEIWVLEPKTEIWVLEVSGWVVYSSSDSSWYNLWVSKSCSVMSDSLWPHELQPTSLFCPWNSPDKNTGVRVWGNNKNKAVSIPFSRGSSWPRDWLQVSCIAGRFFTVWVTKRRGCDLRLGIISSVAEVALSTCRCRSWWGELLQRGREAQALRV